MPVLLARMSVYSACREVQLQMAVRPWELSPGLPLEQQVLLTIKLSPALNSQDKITNAVTVSSLREYNHYKYMYSHWVPKRIKEILKGKVA